MIKWKRTFVLLALFAAACDQQKIEEGLEQVSKDNSYACDTCEPYVPVSNGAHSTRVPDPIEPSTCALFVLLCNYCEYDEYGRFVGAGFSACGVCAGLDI